MGVVLSDEDIERLIAERKPTNSDLRSAVALKSKRAHREWQHTVIGAEGSEFRIIGRCSLLNPFDFSVILAYVPPASNQVIRLRRYNGNSHWHTNVLEGGRLRGFHVHKATERYQELGTEIDVYAEETTRYSDFHGALDCLLRDCGFEVAAGGQLSIHDALD